MTASIKLMTLTMDGCLIPDEFGRRRVILSESGSNTTMFTVEM